MAWLDLRGQIQEDVAEYQSLAPSYREFDEEGRALLMGLGNNGWLARDLASAAARADRSAVRSRVPRSPDRPVLPPPPTGSGSAFVRHFSGCRVVYKIVALPRGAGMRSPKQLDNFIRAGTAGAAAQSHRVWTEAEEERLAALYFEGVSWPEIATCIGRGEAVCRMRLGDLAERCGFLVRRPRVRST